MEFSAFEIRALDRRVFDDNSTAINFLLLCCEPVLEPFCLGSLNERSQDNKVYMEE